MASILFTIVLACPLIAQVPGDAEIFIRDATITVERTHVTILKPDGSYPDDYVPPIPVRLDADDSKELKDIILRAYRSNREDEIQAAKEGSVLGGVPSCESYDYEFTFECGDVRVRGALHLCAGWMSAGQPIRYVMFSHKQRDRLATILGYPFACRDLSRD
jgi:hypothetical protein